MGKTITMTRKKYDCHNETLALMSKDILQNIYDMTDDYMDWYRAARIVNILVEEFEKELNWQDNDERDFITELEKFEQKALERLEREINIKNKWD